MTGAQFIAALLTCVVIWLVPIPLAARMLRTKGRSPHWAYWGIVPPCGWLIFCIAVLLEPRRPRQFVLSQSHGGDGVRDMACTDASTPDPPAARPTGAADSQLRLIAALFAENTDTILMAYSPDSSLVTVNGAPVRIHIFPAGETDADGLRSNLAAVVRQGNQVGQEIHVVVLGGGARVRETVCRSMPVLHQGRLGFHHIDDTGAAVSLGRAKLPLLENALARMDAIAPPAAAAVSRLLADGEMLARSERDVAQKLAGRSEITATITVTCATLMALALLWGDGDVSAVLYQMGANARWAVADGDAWRLLSSAFLHASGIHLAMNMLALWGFGTLLEAVLGWRRYLLLYVLAALGGSLASAGLRSSMSVGASGAIWGLMLGGLALTLWPRGVLPAALATQMRQRAWLPLFVNGVYSLQPGVDAVAHIGGGIVGFLLVATVMTRGLVPVETRQTSRETESGRRIGLTASAACAALAVGLSLGMALAHGRPWEWARPTAWRHVPVTGTNLSIALPASLVRTSAVSRNADGTTVATFGHLLALPVAFEVVVSRRDAPIEVAEIDKILDTLREALDAAPTGHFTRSSPAQRILVGSNPALLARFKGDGVNLDCYMLVMADTEILVRSYTRTKSPPAWSGVTEEVVASIGLR